MTEFTVGSRVYVTDLGLRAELERWKERALNREAEVEGLEAERAGDDLAIEMLRAELERLRAELGQYADRRNWFQTTHLQQDTWPVKVWAWDDQREPWTMAQKALGEEQA